MYPAGIDASGEKTNTILCTRVTNLTCTECVFITRRLYCPAQAHAGHCGDRPHPSDKGLTMIEYI